MHTTRFDNGTQRLVYDHVQGMQVGRFNKKGQRLKQRRVSFWSFFHQEGDEEPQKVGPEYKTQAELLADLTRYGTEFGFN